MNFYLNEEVISFIKRMPMQGIKCNK